MFFAFHPLGCFYPICYIEIFFLVIQRDFYNLSVTLFITREARFRSLAIRHIFLLTVVTLFSLIRLIDRGREAVSDFGRKTTMDFNLAETLQQLVNDRQAFKTALEQLYRTAFHILHNHHEAEDVVQQSLLNALQNEHAFERQCLVTTWLNQIVYHQALDVLRHHHRFPHVALKPEIVSPLTSNLEATLNNRIDGGRILAALPRLLTATEAKVVRYYYKCGWTSKEIAALCGKTPASVRQLLHRALLKLRHYFTPNLCHEAEAQKAGRHSGRLFRRSDHWESGRSAAVT
jgi:RNA polymerase sigma-70 factor (ECF subfamily)